VSILGPTDTVAQFNKIEFGVQLPEWINQSVDAFLNKGKGVNPFDPEQISIEALFYPVDLPKSKPTIVFGFYYKDYQSIKTDQNFEYWEEIPTEWNWRIRFAPDLTGKWSVQVKVITRKETYESAPLTFKCSNSPNPGYLEVDPDHKRFLRFSDSEAPFFAIGMNIAFPWYPKGCYGSDPVEFEKHRNNIDKLGQTSANFIRLVLGPKTYNFEWEELNNYDAPFVLKNNFPEKINKVGRLALAWELDKTIETLEKNDLYYLLCFEFHFPFMDFNPYFPGDPYVWPNNPYKDIAGISDVVDFFTEEGARNIYKNKLRYFFARWGYSSHLAAFEFYNEMQFFGGKKISGNNYYPYFEEDDFIKKLETWHVEMINYLKQELKVRQLLTSSYNTSPREIDHLNDHLDVISMHRYGNKQSLNVINRHIETSGYMGRWEKPFIIGECGLYDDAIHLYKCMPDPFINDMWATSMMGGFGTGLNWWWSDILENDLELNFNILASFMDAVDLQNNNYIIKLAGFDEIENPTIEYLALADEKGGSMMGWVHNYQFYWNNLYQFYDSCLTANNLNPIFDDPTKPDKLKCQNLRIENTNLVPGKYTIRWFNTQTGEWDTPCKKVVCKSNGSVTLKIPVLGDDPADQKQPSNYAFILEHIKTE